MVSSALDMDLEALYATLERLRVEHGDDPESRRLRAALPHAELDSLANLVLHFVTNRELTDRVDLSSAVAFVLFGVQVVGLRRPRRKPVIADHLLVDLGGHAVGTAVLVLDERQQRQTLQG